LGTAVEHEFAQPWIFKARGSQSPPDDVLIVSMDESSRPQDTPRSKKTLWDRKTYAQLIVKLNQLGASTIVFDVAFEGARDEVGDLALETALAEANNVVLFQRLIRDEMGDTTVRPFFRFAKSARMLGVFPLPKTPARVDYFWPFFKSLERTHTNNEYFLKDLPSLPVAALQMHALHHIGYPAFNDLLANAQITSGNSTRIQFDVVEPLTEMVTLLRMALRDLDKNSEIPVRTAQYQYGNQHASSALVSAMMDTYKLSTIAHINFYGPPQSILTLAHNDILGSSDREDTKLRNLLTGRAVFIGYSSMTAIDQSDGFLTVYSSDDGVDLSGVEVAATAFSNLLDGSMLWQLTAAQTTLFYLLLGILTTAITLRFGSSTAIILTAALSMICFVVAVFFLRKFYLLLPIGTPVLLQLPITLVSGLLYQHLKTRRQRDRYLHGANMLLPQAAIRSIEAETVDCDEPKREYGTCLITDIAGFTPLSESIQPEHLAALSSEYFSLLSDCIKRRGGELVDLDGDSLTGVWINRNRTSHTGQQACLASIDIKKAVDQFNFRHPDTPFVTRIGLNSGWVASGSIGGGGSYRYRVMGDVMNTTSRLEGLNKRLGTRILASQSVVEHLNNVLIRNVGVFMLKGKGESVKVYEVVDNQRAASKKDRSLCVEFELVMKMLKISEFGKAKNLLANVLSKHQGDGPSQFYMNLLSSEMVDGVGLDSSGIARVSRK
jgi:adenylate cyclase